MSTNKNAKKRINFNVDKDLHKQFRIKTFENDESMAEALIKAMEWYIREN